jgi:hypothetical protein
MMLGTKRNTLVLVRPPLWPAITSSLAAVPGAARLGQIVCQVSLGSTPNAVNPRLTSHPWSPTPGTGPVFARDEGDSANVAGADMPLLTGLRLCFPSQFRYPYALVIYVYWLV